MLDFLVYTWKEEYLDYKENYCCFQVYSNGAEIDRVKRNLSDDSET